MYALLTKRKVKMPVYLPSSTSSRSIETQKKKKKRMRPISAILTEQAWSIKDLLCGGPRITPKNFAFAGTERAIPSGKDPLG